MGMKSYVHGQLRQPSGRLSRGVALALNNGNRRLIRQTVESLRIEAGETVVDLGFGGGYSLSLLMRGVKTGTTIGIEISQAMRRRAEKKFARPIRIGRLRILSDSAESLTLGDSSVDRLMTCNTTYFWPDLQQGLQEIYRVLKPGGRFVIGNRSISVLEGVRFDPTTHNLVGDDRMRQYLFDAGFRAVEILPCSDRIPSRIFAADKA